VSGPTRLLSENKVFRFDVVRAEGTSTSRAQYDEVDSFRVPRDSGTIARNVHESDLRTTAVSCAKDYLYLNAAIGSTRMADDLLKPLILLTDWSEAARIPLAVAGGSPCALQSARRAWMTSMRAARAAGTMDATTAAVSSTHAERITGKAPGIFTSRK
jgi:hypothetical protein